MDRFQSSVGTKIFSLVICFLGVFFSQVALASGYCGRVTSVYANSDQKSQWVSVLVLFNGNVGNVPVTPYNDQFVYLRDQRVIAQTENILDVAFLDYNDDDDALGKLDITICLWLFEEELVKLKGKVFRFVDSTTSISLFSGEKKIYHGPVSDL